VPPAAISATAQRLLLHGALRNRSSWPRRPPRACRRGLGRRPGLVPAAFRPDVSLRRICAWAVPPTQTSPSTRPAQRTRAQSRASRTGICVALARPEEEATRVLALCSFQCLAGAPQTGCSTAHVVGANPRLANRPSSLLISPAINFVGTRLSMLAEQSSGCMSTPCGLLCPPAPSASLAPVSSFPDAIASGQYPSRPYAPSCGVPSLPYQLFSRGMRLWMNVSQLLALGIPTLEPALLDQHRSPWPWAMLPVNWPFPPWHHAFRRFLPNRQSSIYYDPHLHTMTLPEHTPPRRPSLQYAAIQGNASCRHSLSAFTR